MGADNNKSNEEKIRKLEEELKRLKRQKKKDQEVLSEIDKITNESQHAWVRNQAGVDSLLDDLQSHFEKKLGIENE